MQSSVLTAVLLPVALGVVMLGLGLSLTLADFTRVVKFPRAVFVGLSAQMVLLPAAAFALAKGFELSPELAVGLVLLAASPGGATANLFSHLAHGDVALNVTLTAVNSVLALFTLPLLVNLALVQFVGAEKAIPMQFAKVAQVFVIVLGPVSLGMLIRSKKRELAERLQRPVRVLSVVVLASVIIATMLAERERLPGFFAAVGVPTLLFNLLSMGVGFFLPRLFRLEPKQAIAISMETGVHNGTLAIAIASAPTLLNNQAMAVPSAVYGLMQFVTAGFFAWWVSRSVRAPAVVQPSLET